MLLPFPKILLILLILSKNLPATARANIIRIFISIPSFRFVLFVFFVANLTLLKSSVSPFARLKRAKRYLTLISR